MAGRKGGGGGTHMYNTMFERDTQDPGRREERRWREPASSIRN